MGWLLPLIRILPRILLIPFSYFSYFANRKHHWFQYLFFLRIPVGFAITLIALPIVGHWQFPVMARNLFDLDGIGLLIVTVLALLLSWVTMYTFWLIYITAPQHYRLTFNRDRHREHRKLGHYSNVLPRLMKQEIAGLPLRHVLFGLLSTFLIGECYVQSTSGDLCNAFAWASIPQERDCRTGSIIVGVLMAVVIWFVLDKTSHTLAWAFTSIGSHHHVQPLLKPIEETWMYISKQVNFAQGMLSEHFVFIREHHMRQAHEPEDQDVLFTKQQALTLGLMTLVFYVAGFTALHPSNANDLPGNIPPLAYILMLLILLAWVLPKLTLVLDLYRIPVLFSAVALTLVFQWGTGSDYFYKLIPLDKQQPQTRLSEAYAAWRHPAANMIAPHTLVVVAASGGGITASTWTATVLTELQNDPELRNHFARSIFLLSATSGGSVGAMYFVDAYDTDGLTNKSAEELANIVAHASTSVSGAAGWGVVYPDFWRLFPFLTLGVRLFPEHYDRAWALERTWERTWLARGEKPPTLHKWEQGIREGWRPILIFNATISETGEPFLLMPISLTDSSIRGCATLPSSAHSPSRQERFRTRELFELYPTFDMSVVTAARLSASFPFLSPLARPARHPDADCKAYHVADGGYFDNFGVTTTLSVLNEVLQEELKASRMKDKAGISSSPHLQVVILEIRAFNSKNMAIPSSETTLLEEIGRPFMTMENTRWSSQLIRNTEDISRFIAQWAEKGIPVLDVIFEQDSESPLSWHLTNQDKDKLVRSFKDQQEPISCIRRAMTELSNPTLTGKCDKTGLHK